MVVAGGTAWGTDALVGLTFVAGFALANLWGFLIWRSRHRWNSRVAMQAMLGGLAVAFAAVVLLVNQQASTWHLPYWVLLVIPAVMVLLWFLLGPRNGAAQLDDAADEASPRS